MKQILLFFFISTLFAQQTGECGTDCIWTFFEAGGKLTISGSGKIDDYNDKSPTYKQYVEKITSLSIGNEIKEIGSHAFEEFTQIIQIEFGTAITKIGEYAFNGCSKVKNAMFSGSVTEIGNNAFSNCKSMTMAFLGFGLKSLSKSIFENCTSLKVYILQQNIERIEERAFYGCSQFSMITFTKSLQYIGKSAFEQTGLVSLDLIAITIDENAFRNCISLRQIFVRDVQTIGNNAFSNNPSLEHVILDSETQTIGKEAFYNCSKLKDFIYYGVSQPKCEENALMEITEVTVDSDYHFDKFCTSKPTVMGTVESSTKSFSAGAIATIIIIILLLLIIIIGLLAFILYSKFKEEKKFEYEFIKFKESESQQVNDDNLQLE